MTDLAVEDQPSNESSSTAQTAGGLLKQARERQQVDIAVLASMLKVPEQKIRALEENRLDALPDLAFARSLAASLARTLAVDAKQVLALLPKAKLTASREAHEPLNAPYRLQSEGGSLGRAFSALQSRYLWVVLALLLAAVVLALLPQVRESKEVEDQGSGTVSGGMVTRELSSGVSGVAEQAAPVVPVVPAVPLAPAFSLPASAPLPSASASTELTLAVPEATASAAAPSAAVAAAGELSLSTTQDSWIQVHDATGKQLFSRILRAGETAGVDGTPPYKLVVGSVPGVSLMVRGEAFDLAAAAKGARTARVTVP